jgi:hypothetical protein
MGGVAFSSTAPPLQKHRHLWNRLPTATHGCPVLRCCSAGIAIRGRAYDIILAKDATDFVLKSWFDTRPGAEGLAPPHRLCICLNPVSVHEGREGKR